jgi:phytoene desaturase (3,4-didehydrolycopene-forming)
MDSIIPSLNAHNIFLVGRNAVEKRKWGVKLTPSQAEDYKGSFDDIFKSHSMPREPSFYVNVPSRVDPSAAPEGKDTIVVLVPVGHLLSDEKTLNTPQGDGQKPTQDWDALVNQAREQIIHTMETRLGISGLKEKITWEGINTPVTCELRFCPFSMSFIPRGPLW